VTVRPKDLDSSLEEILRAFRGEFWSFCDCIKQDLPKESCKGFRSNFGDSAAVSALLKQEWHFNLTQEMICNNWKLYLQLRFVPVVDGLLTTWIVSE
jgi:hypothetical protein